MCGTSQESFVLSYTANVAVIVRSTYNRYLCDIDRQGYPICTRNEYVIIISLYNKRNIII